MKRFISFEVYQPADFSSGNRAGTPAPTRDVIVFAPVFREAEKNFTSVHWTGDGAYPTAR